MRNFIRNLVAGVLMLLLSLAAFGGPLEGLKGEWAVDGMGNWKFCVTSPDEAGYKMCWDVPYVVTSTKQARL